MLNRAKRVGNVLVMGDERDGADNLSEKVAPSSKIALCFLVRETLNQPSAWEMFLANHEGGMRYIATQT